jgi:hypothetical protein
LEYCRGEGRKRKLQEECEAGVGRGRLGMKGNIEDEAEGWARSRGLARNGKADGQEELDTEKSNGACLEGRGGGKRKDGDRAGEWSGKCTQGRACLAEAEGLKPA